MPAVKNQTDRPADTPFRQQRLPAWQPILTPKWVIITFTSLGLVFIPIGLVVVSISNVVVEVVQRYDDLCPAPPSDCTINVTIPAEMQPPIYFYYQLTNFYQNHRRYVKSRSDAQLRGVGDLSDSDLANCEPMVMSSADPGKVLYPCGLIANSFFTDQFNATLFAPGRPNATRLTGANWDRTGIAWSTDVQQKFKKPRRNYDDVTRFTDRPGIGTILLPEVVDEELIVWMRTAGMPTFKKLNRIISETVIAAGTVLQIHINNQFPVAGFQGQKAVVLSTTSVLGGKNPFLGYAYISVGTIALVLAALFLAKHYHSPRTLGDMTYFNWNLSDKRVHPAPMDGSTSRPGENAVSELGPKSVGDDK